MKTWNTPAATVQKFAANEYVSACTAMINCNVPLQEGFPYYIQEYGKTIECVGVGDRTYGYYSPCGEPYHEVGTNGELVPYTFTKGLAYDENGKINSKVWVDLPEPVECFVWYVYNEDGLLEDVHNTLTADGLEINKS